MKVVVLVFTFKAGVKLRGTLFKVLFCGALVLSYDIRDSNKTSVFQHSYIILITFGQVPNCQKVQPDLTDI